MAEILGNKIQYLFILFFFAEKQKYSILQRELFYNSRYFYKWIQR